MEITTLRCTNCGTIVAENVLETERIMKCPHFQCDEILSYEDIQRKSRINGE